MSPLPAPWVPRSPVAAEIDAAVGSLNLEARAMALDRSPAFPREEFRELGARRLLGLAAPAALGGRGLARADAGAALFELAYRSGATTFAKLSLQPEFCAVLGESGSPELRAREFLPLCRGERLIGNHLTEPSAGSDLRRIATVAEPVPGGYRVTGTKSEAAFATDAEAAIVLCAVPARDGNPGGLTPFLIPQSVGSIVRTTVPDLGERWMRRGSVEYRGVEVSADARIGPEGGAMGGARAELDRDRALLAMIYLGVGRRSLEETVRQVGERTAFGTPLSRHEAVGFPLAEDWAELEAATQFALAVLRRGDAGEAVGGAAAMAKWQASAVSLRIQDHAIQFHGGRGYSSALPFEQRWRDVRSGGLAHGTSEIMHLAAARQIWGGRSGSDRESAD